MTEASAQTPNRRRCAGGITARQLILLDAWSQVAPAVERFHLDRGDNGRDRIVVALNGMDGPEAGPAWVIWPEAGAVLAEPLLPQPGRRHHPSLRAALQAIGPISEAQWVSVDLIAAAMRLYRDHALDPAHIPQPSLKLAA